MEKLATDIYSFQELRTSGFTYVDKTAILLPLVDFSIGKLFFMARPRRFGKSLLISTLQCLFEGRRDLFQGLAIEPNWDWSKSWPVLHLDMGSCAAETIEKFNGRLNKLLFCEAERLGVDFKSCGDCTNDFITLINAVVKKYKNQMVLLIDEYDKPLLSHLSKPDVLVFRDALKSFYSVIKTYEAKQRFAFITGVSKFSKVSIFSDLNNLKDRTMTLNEATLLGYTHEELKKYFPETIKHIAEVNGCDEIIAFNEILKWYDGYRFHHKAEHVINPVSFGLCAESNEFKNYWSITATPTFLIDALKLHPLNFSSIGIDEITLEAYEPSNPRLVTLLYQTGYLTIKSFKMIGCKRKYNLDFPNYEVADAFLSMLVPVYAKLDETDAVNYQYAAQEALLAGDADKFFDVLKSFCANIPYNLTDRQNEQTWQAIVYVILRAIGVSVNAEVVTNNGRIDMTCDIGNVIWLMEFKLDHPADEALAQIERNNYADKFDFTGKRVIRAGVSFSSKKRCLDEIKIV